MSEEIKWYRLDEILKKQAQYYIIIGERSNGKTYATLQHIIDSFFKNGTQFGYVKRFDEDIKSKYMSEVFSHLEEYILETYNKRIKFYRGQWLLYEDGVSGKISECEVFGYAFSLAQSNRVKGTSYPSVDVVLFEEFMSIDCTYLPDEINLLLNLVSTIARHRTSVKIFMLANTISKYNPYFSSLGLKVHRMEKGKILHKTFVDKKGFKTSFALERTENVNVYDNSDNKDKIVYNIFGDSGVGSMITSGDFEVHKYPKTIDKYTFEENKNLGKKYIGKQYKTTMVLRFEDYFYRIYLIDDNVKFISAYREININTINFKNTTHIINGIIPFKNIVNINNIMSFNASEYNNLFDVIISTIKQRDFIIISDDDGENIINGYRLAGLSYIHK
ncbi:phage DNA encapsidation protein [Romboutsia sp.]|uniref:phage DNA encapsidation protein n=1 Tax=Romboutsia sp. TaxID=1965302 RepID=UPI003F3C41E9